MNKKILYILISIILITVSLFIYFNKNRGLDFKENKIEDETWILNQELSNKEDLGENNNPTSNLEGKKEEKGIEKISVNDSVRNETQELPSKIYRKVDFVSQAPFGIWDELHEESCEEASLIMVYYYLSQKKLTKEKMEEEIQALVKYQEANYGDYKDSDMKQLKELAENYYEIKNVRLLADFNIEDLKLELADEKLIVVPAAGRELGNPNFTLPGPLYHNLVLIGYDDEQGVFITNDPGTRKGENYEYNYKVLFEAIHDFPGKKSDILKGEKMVLVF